MSELRRMKEMYENFKWEKNKRMMIHRMNRGSIISEQMIRQYNITLADVNDLTIIHPDVMNYLTGN